MPLHVDPAELDRFVNGHVFFNHFIPFERRLSIPLLACAWNRGAAVFCQGMCPNFDLVIPVLLADTPNSDVFGPMVGKWDDHHQTEALRHMSFILINAKK